MSFELDYRPFPLPVLSARPSLLPFLADHHLPYIVPAVVFWLISLFESLIPPYVYIASS